MSGWYVNGREQVTATRDGHNGIMERVQVALEQWATGRFRIGGELRWCESYNRQA